MSGIARYRCPVCQREVRPGARFCRHCGAAVAMPSRRPAPAPAGGEWLALDDVMCAPNRQLAGLGALFVFFGAFAPWTVYSVSFFGFEIGEYSMFSPYAVLIALIALISIMALFHRRGGSVLLAVGLLITIWTLLFGLTALGNGSPSWGLVLSLLGGCLLAFAGFRINQFAR